MKQIDAFTFTGNIRQYPSFQIDYERHMLPSYGNDLNALQHFLSGEALMDMKGMDNDLKEMLRDLDLKYGSSISGRFKSYFGWSYRKSSDRKRPHRK